ncbi:MAG TPA: YceI family protein [Terriglobales bacterium]|nr:YceI family protein [Terriglobales bacterium]
MRRKVLISVSVFAFSLLAAADSQWTLQQSAVAYSASHPLHHFEGVSHGARGKGICRAGECQFLIAAPVNSFNSGDSNRDLHMLQVTRGAQFPMVVVRTQLRESDVKPGTLHADLQIQFAGQTANYKQLPFQVTMQGNDIRLIGTIPATLSDFKIPPPTLLTIPIKNEIPVRVDMTWKPGP